jgi:hypothetical protein
MGKKLGAADLEVRIARGRQDMLSACRLVYRCYLSRGYIRPNRYGLVYRKSYGLPTSRTIVAVDRSRVIGTLSVVGDGGLGLQIDATYGAETQALRDQGRRLAEITGLAIEPSSSQRDIGVFAGLARLMFQYAERSGRTDLVLAINPRHKPFYVRWFHVDLLGPTRPHRLVCNNPAVGCRIDMQTVKQSVNQELLDWFVNRRLPASHLDAPGVCPADHQFLCRLAGILGDGTAAKDSEAAFRAA